MSLLLSLGGGMENMNVLCSSKKERKGPGGEEKRVCLYRPEDRKGAMRK